LSSWETPLTRRPGFVFANSLRRLALVALAMLLGTGCWEQWSNAWWPQMKWQKAVQAYEDTGIPGQPQGFTPPEGTVPIGYPVSPAELSVPEQEAQKNPQPATLASLEKGKAEFAVFCAPCHGIEGHGNGPVAGPPFGKGPFVGVLPIAGPASLARVLTDGHIYTTISLGRGRMPSYRRIPPEDRWDIINYVRYLNGQTGPQSAGGTPQ
jgi:mono/diheme cytochrome c family protein